MARSLKSFPHHKHIETGAIIESKQIKLSDVLLEIEEAIIDNWKI